MRFFHTVKPKHPYIVSPFVFAVVNELSDNEIFSGSKYIGVFECYRCVGFYEFLGGLSKDAEVNRVIVDVFSIASSLFSALSYLHRSHEGSHAKYPVVHRCIFPHSFYVSFEEEQATFKLANFQFSVVLFPDTNDTTLKRARAPCRNPLDECPDMIRYTAAELLIKNDSVSVSNLASDVYSAGCVVWQLYAASFDILAHKLTYSINHGKYFRRVLPLDDIFTTNSSISRPELFDILLSNYKFQRYELVIESEHLKVLTQLCDLVANCTCPKPEHRFTAAKAEAFSRDLYAHVLKAFPQTLLKTHLALDHLLWRNLPFNQSDLTCNSSFMANCCPRS